MKNSSLLLALVVLLTASCDDRNRKFEKNLEVFQMENQQQENAVVYMPKSYTEIKTDTIFSNDLKVHIKYYSLMDSSIPKISKDNITVHHRNFQSEIQVYKKEKLVFDKLITKSLFATSEESEFWKQAILQYVWVDDSVTNLDKVSINCSFLVPESQDYKAFVIYISNRGEQEIISIETS